MEQNPPIQGLDTRSKLRYHLLEETHLVVRQKKNWWQIITDLEARNKYGLHLENGEQIGWIVEKAGGFFSLLKRWILGTHRPFQCLVTDMMGNTELIFGRSFFWFFSDIFVMTDEQKPLGSAHRRFAFFHKRYDLKGPTGEVFATINAGFWRIWTFRIYDPSGQERAVISKKWGGAVKEYFTDADTFLVDFGLQGWKPFERAVILAVALSVDFDFFERNSGSGGGLTSLLPDG